MFGDKRFNIRVYGIWIHEGRVLVSEEEIKEKKIVKFPGGGMNFGEGTIDAIKREWLEELNMDVNILSHFYTTDYFQPSAFDDSQVISIYYKVEPVTLPEYIVNSNENESCYWLKLDEITSETFSLPIDKKVGELLKQ